MVTKTPKVEEAPSQGNIIGVPLARLVPNPWDPRRERTPEAVRDMAESIRQVGLLQNLTARLGKDGHYELAYGMTRLLALRQLAEAGQGAEAVPVVFRALSDAEMAIISLTENSQRSDLTPLEKYRAYKKALDTIPELTITGLAQSLGIDQSTLSNAMRLLKLPPVVLDRVESGEMSAYAAREFLCLVADDHMHTDLMDRVVSHVANTRLGAAPDWRAANLRRLIQEMVQRSTVEHWRRLGSFNDRDHLDNYGGSHQANPLFDVEAFQRELPHKVHNLPWDAWDWDTTGRRMTKERSLAWTCDVKEWGRRQDAAKRGAAGKSGPARTPTAPPEQEQVRQKVLTTDPVARRVAAEPFLQKYPPKAAAKAPQVVPEDAKVPQTAPKLTKVPQRVDATTLTQEQRLELGTRDKPVNLSKHRGFVKVLDPTYEITPQYFPDLDECSQRCTDGAAYGYQSYNSKPVLCCLNQKHYNEKLAAGRAKAEAEMKKHLELEEVATRGLAEEITRLLLDLRLARMVAIALVATGDFKHSRYMGEWWYEPYTLTRARELLGLPKGNNYRPLGEQRDLARRIPSIPVASLREVAALLLIHTLRAAGAVDGLIPGEEKA